MEARCPNAAMTRSAVAQRVLAWRDPPYEYETVKRPIDILFGNCRFREALERSAVQAPAELADLLFLDKAAWRKGVGASALRWLMIELSPRPTGKESKARCGPGPQ